MCHISQIQNFRKKNLQINAIEDYTHIPQIEYKQHNMYRKSNYLPHLGNNRPIYINQEHILQI